MNLCVYFTFRVFESRIVCLFVCLVCVLGEVFYLVLSEKNGLYKISSGFFGVFPWGFFPGVFSEAANICTAAKENNPVSRGIVKIFDFN